VNAAQVLERARTKGIALSGEGGRLRYEAPAGRLTPDLREALAANKAAILDILEAERLAGQHIVQCRNCEHHIASPSVSRASGAVWEMPGGCARGRTRSDAIPPTYPCTGWYCDSWTSKRVH
jgi:hypothetical protein